MNLEEVLNLARAIGQQAETIAILRRELAQAHDQLAQASTRADAPTVVTPCATKPRAKRKPTPA